MNKKYRFITFEGGEGSGKTTQSKMLYEHLLKQGMDVIWTREIGGTSVAETLRDIILFTEIERKTELLLIMAARNEHLERLIKPALKEGKVVICDRFVDSTAAYQSDKEKEIDQIYQLNESILGGLLPDITFYMDMNPEQGLRRANARGDTNKYEHKDLDFHHKIYNNFAHISNKFPGRVRPINASREQSQIFDEILKILAC